MEEYIYSFKNSLSNEICREIIKYFDDDITNKYDGITFKGLDKRVKDARDIVIPYKNYNESKWDKINDLLSEELSNKLKLYVKYLNNKDNYKAENNYNIDYHHLFEDLYLLNNFMIQRYEQNIGKYVYHDDGATVKDKQRVITYIWYLNDVEEGGETEFFGGNIKIKPEEGKLLFFPANWAFPHRGNKPRSSHKYIITGWLYKQNETNNDVHKIPYISEATKISINDSIKINYDNNIINNDDANPKEEITFELVTTSHNTITVTKTHTDLLFNYLYLQYPFIFKNYKNCITHNSNSIEDIYIDNIYTKQVCNWIIYQIEENIINEMWDTDLNNKYVELDICFNIIPYIIASFQIITDITKTRYNLNNKLNFNVKKWYICKYTDDTIIEEFKKIQSDLVFQIVLSDINNNADNDDDNINGKIFITKEIKYFPRMKIVLVLFVDFSFIYFNKDNIKINLSLKELIDKTDLINYIE